MLRLWDSHEVVEIMSLTGDPMSQARFSPDGSRIGYATAGVELSSTIQPSFRMMRESCGGSLQNLG